MRSVRDADVRKLVAARLKVKPDADHDVEDDPVAAGEPEGVATSRADNSPGRSRVALVVPPIVAGLLALALLVLFLANRHHDGADAAGTAAAEVVEPRVEQLLSYTPATVASDVEEEAAWLTGDFADDYRALMAETVAPAAVAGEVATTATVTAAGIDSATSDRVVLLLFVNVSTTSAETPEAVVSGSRLRVTAVERDGEWRISEVRPL